MKALLVTLFIKQNQYHKYSVLRHTLEVARECVKNKRYDFLAAAILHDIGKPVVASQDEEDIIKKTYSFTGHEEKSYQIIKNWRFVSEKTKILVRYHYLITGMASDLRKYRKTQNNKFLVSYESRLEIWDSLSEELQNSLLLFKIFDDNGKGYPDLEKAVPEFLAVRLNNINKL